MIALPPASSQGMAVCDGAQRKLLSRRNATTAIRPRMSRLNGPIRARYLFIAAGSPDRLFPRPLDQLVGPPGRCMGPASEERVADVAVLMVRVLERAGIDRHFINGPAPGTNIFTTLAGSHTGFGTFQGHKGE
jgi:hypothetical protein